MQTTLPSSSPSSLMNVTPLSSASQHFSKLEKSASFKFALHANQCICPTLMKQIPPNNLLTAVAIPLPDDDDSDNMEQTSFPFPHCMRSSLQGSDPNPAQTHCYDSDTFHFFSSCDSFTLHVPSPMTHLGLTNHDSLLTGTFHMTSLLTSS